MLGLEVNSSTCLTHDKQYFMVLLLLIQYQRTDDYMLTET